MGLYKQSCPCKVWEIGSCHMTSHDVHVAQYTYHTVCAPTPRMHLSAIPQLYSRSIPSLTSGPKDYSHTHTHAHTHTHTHTCTHTHTRAHTHMHTHTHTHAHTSSMSYSMCCYHPQQIGDEALCPSPNNWYMPCIPH